VLKIRSYQPADNAAVKTLHFAGIAQMQEDPGMERIPRPPSHDADLDNIENIYLNGGAFIVGLEGEEIVAMGAFKRKSTACAEFKRLRIRPDRQRRGYGEMITLKLMELAKEMGYTEAFLDMLPTNYRSRALCEKLGFVKSGEGQRGPYHLYYFTRSLVEPGNSPLGFRRYQPQDNAAARELNNAGLKQMAPDVNWEGVEVADGDYSDIENIYINQGGDFLVGTLNNEVVVTGAVKRLTDICAEIKRIRVKPESQRKGYGEAMLKKLMERARELGYTKIRIDTMTTNTRAQQLFNKAGFTFSHQGKIGDYPVNFYYKDI
jgi:ribosomal protein S18 acetylase RimI-like enzyme